MIFFQAYMVAPLIPKLSSTFGVSSQTISLIVPAYMIPYGISTLFYGLLSDRLGRLPIMLVSLIAFVVLTALTATSQSAAAMMVWRLLTGLGASGVVPLALALMGDLFPYEQRGRPLGWLFGAMAGGMAFGSTFGVLLEPFIGWRTLGQVFAGYGALLGTTRGIRTYTYVLLNAIFHSGVFTWLGVYFIRRYSLGEVGVGLALLGYGMPGMILGPVIGRAADRLGRRRLVPAGLAIAALSAAMLIPKVPLLVTALAVTTLSLGYDMTQPLLAGIVTSLDPKRGGQAMGFNVLMLFTGFGVGSFLFGEALSMGFESALAVFSTIEMAIGVAAFLLFRSETTANQTSASSPLRSS